MHAHGTRRARATHLAITRIVGSVFYSVPHPWLTLCLSSVAVVWYDGPCEPLRHDGKRAPSSRILPKMRTINNTPATRADAPSTLRGIRRLARGLW
jgi:hypothetical protein